MAHIHHGETVTDNSITTSIGEVLKQIRERVPLMEIFTRHGYAVRPSGPNRMVTLCPFHADRRRPNLVIYRNEQRFFCFKCGSRGDVIDLVQFLDRHSDFLAALRALADELHINWPAGRPAAVDGGRSILTLAARIYATELTGRPLAYLEHRGFPEPFVRKWRLGYAPPNDPLFLCNRLKHAGISPGAALAAGLVMSVNDDKGPVRDFFVLRSEGGYVTLPNSERDGTVTDLQGRAFPEHHGKPKYLNLPRPRRRLFNESMLPHAQVILTEGILDALSCLLVGISAVAIYGASGFTDKLALRLATCRRVYVAFDRDIPERSIDAAICLGLRGRVLVLPDRLGRKGDVNDLLVQQGPEQFRSELQSLMASAETGYAMAIKRLPNDLRVTDLFETAAPLLAAMGAMDPISRDAHLKLLHVKYDIGMDTLQDAAREALQLAQAPP